MAEKAIEDIKDDFLNCTICLNRFNVPKMLPCIHSFCEECLEKHVAKLQGQKLACPICRTIFDLPESGVTGIKTNFHLVNLGERMDLYESLKSTDETSQKCQSCKNGAVSAFCFDCDFAICDKCQSQHSWFPQLRSHTITSVETTNQSKFNQSRGNVRSQFCAEHRSEKIQFYCKTCSKPICRDCTNVQHPEANHDCVEANSECEILAADISGRLKESELQMQATKQFIQDRRVGSSEVTRSTSAMIEKIRKHYDEMMASLDKQLKSQMDEACARVANNEKLQKTRITHIIAKATNWVERMESIQQLTREITKENNMCELLSMSNDLIGAFRELEYNKDEFAEWYFSDFQYEFAFKPNPTPTVQFGDCYTESDIPVVLHDTQGDLILCYFNQESKECKVESLTVSEYDITKANEILTFAWDKEYCSHSKFVACMFENSEIILALGGWLAIINISSKSIKLHLMLDKNPNAVIENVSFDETSGKLFFTKRDNRRFIEVFNIREFMGTITLPCDTVPHISDEMKTYENFTKYDVGHGIRVMLHYNTADIIILTVDGQIVTYNLDDQQTLKPVSGIEADCNIVTIVKEKPVKKRKLEWKRGYPSDVYRHEQPYQYYVILKKVKLGKLDVNVNCPEVQGTECVISLCDGTDNTVKQTWQLNNEYEFPFMCFCYGTSNLKIFNRCRIISL